MKRLLVTLTCAAALFAMPVHAEPEDSDRNGYYSMAEMMAGFPGMTEDQFRMMDANGDGQIDAPELMRMMHMVRMFSQGSDR